MPEKVYAIGNVEGAGLRFQSAAKRSVSGDHESNVGWQLCEGVDENIMAFDIFEPSGRADNAN